MEETEVNCLAGESVRGEISGIVGRRGTFPEVEGRREMRCGEGKVNSLTTIPASLSANWTFRGGLGLEGLFGCRCGIAGGGRVGLGK